MSLNLVAPLYLGQSPNTPKAVVVNVQLDATGAATVRLGLDGDTDGLGFVQAVFVDALDLASGVTIQSNRTGQRVRVPAGVQGWFPLHAAEGRAFTVTGPANAALALQFANSPVALQADLRPGYLALYDFRNNSLSGLPLTVANASGGYMDDTSGNWSFVPPNTLRRSNKGVLIEGAQTNSIRNNSMQGAVVGNPGTSPTNWSLQASGVGLNSSVSGLGKENGVDYIDVRIYGTATSSGNFDLRPELGTITAASGQLWTYSTFVKLVSGSLGAITVAPFIGELSSGGGYLGGSSTQASITGILNRFLTSRTLSNASTASTYPTLSFGGVVSGTAYDFTIRIGWPQFEQWNTGVTTVGGASSPIRTTGTAATRAADKITAPLSVSGAVTMAAVGTSYLGGSNTRLVGGFGNATSPAFAESIYLTGSSAGAIGGNMRSGGTGITASASVTGAPARNAMAFAAQANDLAAAVDGGTVATNGSTQAFPVTANQLVIGSSPWNYDSWFYGYIERLAVYPSRLPNTQLQALSTLTP